MIDNLKKQSKLLLDYLAISIGCMVMALGFNSFFVTNKIAPGGFSGLATVIYYFTGFPIGIVTLILTIPLFFVSIKLLGAKFGLKSFMEQYSFPFVLTLL